MAYQSEIEKLEQRYRENPQQWFAALADSYRKAGSLDLALDVVRAGLEKRPNYVSGHIVHGRCLIDQKLDAEAQAVFERVLELDAENVIAIKALAEIGDRTQHADMSRRWLTRLLEVDPSNEEAQGMLAQLGPAGPEPAPAEPAAAAGEDTALSGAGALLAGSGDEAGAPPAGFEATAVAAPPPAAEPADALVLERTEEAEIGGEISEGPTVEMEPLRLERASSQVGVPEAVAAGEAAPDFELETTALGGDEGFMVEKEESPLPEVAEADSVLALEGVAPFDDALAWGTGERTSRQISAEDVARAEQAHDESLDAAVHALPGMENAEVPAAEDPAWPVDAGEPREAEAEEPESPPMFYPEQAAAPAAAGTGRTVEPEPVVTETMAELYVSQGLLHEARAIYRQLLAQRPGDPALTARLAELETGAAPQKQRRTMTAAQTGGASVRDFLADVFAGGPSGEHDASAPAPRRMTTPPPSAPTSPTVMDAAFEEPGGQPVSGEPTRRASDEVSLAAVFGEEPAPPKAPEPPRVENEGTGSKAFSFDEFFGTPRPGRDSGASPADDDDFKRWLKSLKS